LVEDDNFCVGAVLDEKDSEIEIIDDVSKLKFINIEKQKFMSVNNLKFELKKKTADIILSENKKKVSLKTHINNIH
jgi:hypothetical protein